MIGPAEAGVQLSPGQEVEPPDHTHGTEDEIFYVLQRELSFRCGDDTLT